MLLFRWESNRTFTACRAGALTTTEELIFPRLLLRIIVLPQYSPPQRHSARSCWSAKEIDAGVAPATLTFVVRCEEAILLSVLGMSVVWRIVYIKSPILYVGTVKIVRCEEMSAVGMCPLEEVSLYIENIELYGRPMPQVGVYSVNTIMANVSINM